MQLIVRRFRVLPGALLCAFTASGLAAQAAASSPTPIHAPQADSAIDRAVDAWSGVKTVRARFEQHLINALTGSAAASHGEFQQQRPNHLSIVFTDLSGDRIIGDGRYLWVFLPTSTPGQVLRYPATDMDAAPIDPSAQFLDSPHTRFAITPAGKDTVDGAPATVVVLAPKAGIHAPFVRAKVWISDRDGLIREFETEEQSGVTRRVRLLSLSINGPVDRSAFTFTPPRDVKVVDARS